MPPKTAEELLVIAQKNQIYERLFKRYEKKKLEEESEEDTETVIDIR